jgi:Transposase C of IS166 homeodomain
LKVAEISVQYKTLEIEKLKFQIAKLRRMQFGRSSERISRQIEQLELRLEELETGAAADAAQAEAADPVAPIRERVKPSASRCPIICRARRLCISLPMIAPAPAPIAARAWRGSARFEGPWPKAA